MYKLSAQGLGKMKTTTYHLREFVSLDEFLLFTRDNRNPDMASSTPGSGRRGDFYSSRTFDEAWERAYNGWDTVRPQVDETLDILREQVRDLIDLKPVRVHDLVGFEPDIDRYVAGELECMWDETMVEAPHKGKVFTVLLDVSLACDQDAAEILRRGTVVVALIESFQMLGCELEIWVEQTIGCYDSSRDKLTTLVPIQRAGDRVDINAIMFPLANPDWQRRLIFGAQEAENESMRRKFGIGGGYGTARQGCHMGERVDASIELSLEHSHGLKRLDSAEFIKEQLIAQGVLGSDDE